MVDFLLSLGSLDSVGQMKGSIETVSTLYNMQENIYNDSLFFFSQKFFVVPPVINKTIPYTRVNHNKYMVTDNAAYVGKRQ